MRSPIMGWPGDRVWRRRDNLATACEEMAGLALGGFVRSPMYTPPCHTSRFRQACLSRIKGQVPGAGRNPITDHKPQASRSVHRHDSCDGLL